MVRRLGYALLAALWTSGLVAEGVDYAESRHAGLWLQHPVYGGPSFDAFVHAPQNPLHRGAAPFKWPVNSFFFADPISGNWYIYVGDYPVGYAGKPCRCVLLRSTDRGQSWSNLGVVLEGSKELFDHGGSTPDVSIVYADGRYHMVYDWVEPDWSLLGGLGYAWAEKPEGPWHRAPQPITLNRELKPLLGRYSRTYAATLLRRKHDWMIVAMMDHAPSSWALFGMTAAKPEGPYGERILLRDVEGDGFHPPLLEYYPAFVHRGFVYAPATSVALNRDYNALFRAPLEGAAEPGAWELFQNGSLWHSEDVENEYYGLWGQTFSGWVDGKGMLRVSFHSRDPKGMGTVNVATRRWEQPMRKSGFVMSGHQGPSLTLLQRAFAGFRLEARLRLRGTARLLVDYDGALGPNLPQSDATLHPLALSRCDAVELSEGHWKVIRFGEEVGQASRLAEGGIALDPSTAGETPGKAGGTPAPLPGTVRVVVDRKPGGATSLSLNGRVVWTGELPPRAGTAANQASHAATARVLFPLTPALSLGERETTRPSVAKAESPGIVECGTAPLPLPEGEGWGEGEGTLRIASPHDRDREGRVRRSEDGYGAAVASVLGIEVEPHSHLVVERFAIQGKPQPAVINFLFSEAILGAGGNRDDWQELKGAEFRYGLAALAKAPGARVKWNVDGRQFTLWSPRGPQFGKAQVKLDGCPLAELDLHAERLTPSGPVWKSPRLKDGPHAVVLTATDGLLVVDSIEVTR